MEKQLETQKDCSLRKLDGASRVDFVSVTDRFGTNLLILTYV